MQLLSILLNLICIQYISPNCLAKQDDQPIYPIVALFGARLPRPRNILDALIWTEFILLFFLNPQTAEPHVKTGTGLFDTKRIGKEIEEATKKEEKPNDTIFTSKKNEEIFEKIEKEVLKVDKNASSNKLNIEENTAKESESEGSEEEEEEDE